MDALKRKQLMDRLEKAEHHLAAMAEYVSYMSTYKVAMITRSYVADARRLLEESARPGVIADSPFVPCEYHRRKAGPTPAGRRPRSPSHRLPSRSLPMSDQPDGRDDDPQAALRRARTFFTLNPEAEARAARLRSLGEDLEALGLAPNQAPAINDPLPAAAALTRLAVAVQGGPIRGVGLGRIKAVIAAELTRYGEALLHEFDLDYLNRSGGDPFTEEPLLVQLAEVRWILEHVLTSGDMGRVALVLAIILKIEERLRQQAPEASAQPTD
jgi:hypothetical protein